MDTPCIEFTGALNGSGYGTAYLDGKKMGAHVKSFIQTHGPVPEGHVVMHKCHNRKCINGEHLKSGTQSENILHSVADGRMTQHQNKGYCTGSKSHAAKLTEENVKRIKLAQTEYKYGQDSKIAREYGVTPKVIRDIRMGTIWTSVSLE